jgi:long-chain acyl-CoA synthetase
MEGVMKTGIEIVSRNGRRTVEGLGYYEPRVVKDIRELVRGSAERYGDRAAFKIKDKEGRITCKTYRDLASDVDCLGTALISLGLRDLRISIIGENRYEWAVCYFAIVNGTGIAVPLDRHLPQNEAENLIARGKVDVMFYSPTYHEMMTDIASKNDSMKYFICMERTSEKTVDDPRFISLPELIEKGGKLLETGDKSFTEAEIDRERMSVLLFTSGTTSMSKGVMLSHANLAANVTSITTIIKVYPTDTHLSLLPYHHTFENTVGLMFMLHTGVCIAYCDGIKHIVQNLKEYNVTILVAVPAIFEAMYRKLQEGIRKSGKEKLLNTMIKVSDALRAIGIDLRRKLFKSVFEQLGPGLRIAVSGAAALDREVVIGFEKIGFRLLQGYGLTEASPVIATNNDYINVPGTIGYPMYGIEVAIDTPDENGIGEIVSRGGNVMLGYYEDPAATEDSFTEDGWLRTGDIGYIDEKGLIRITGRAKSMIVLSNGKKAFPEEYEIQLNNIPGIKDSFVWGNTAPDGDVQICAKLVVDKDNAGDGKGGLLPEKELAARFDAAIREINKTVPQYKIIRYFVMTEEELIKANGIKTKRHIEQEKVKSMLSNAGVEIRKVSGRFIERL